MVVRHLKIYVASSFLNKQKAKEFMDYLKRLGFIVTSTWTSNRPNPDLKRLRKESEQDLEELRNSDVLVVLWPGRLGTSAEIGAALALHKPVIMFGKIPLKKSVYFNHPKVDMIHTYADLVDALTDLEETLYA